MKKVLVGLGVLVLVVVIGIVALPALVPIDQFKAQIAEAVKGQTGRDFAIKGEIKLSVIPNLGLSASDVTLANAPGMSPAPMVSFKRLDFDLRLLPLLSRQIEVARLVLVEPVINLEIDAKGRPNWVLEAPAPAGAPKPAQPAQSEAGDLAGLAALDLKLGDVRLESGRISYVDARTKAKVEIKDINLAVKLPDMAQPFAIDGKLAWNGKPITLGLGGQSLRALLSSAGTAINAKIAVDVVTLELGGSTKLVPEAAVDGTLALNVPSVRKLADWLGAPLAVPGTGLGPLAIKGKLKASPTNVAFTAADFNLDAIKAKGEVAVALGGVRPNAKGRLDVETLDLNPYLPPEAPAAGPGKTPTPASAPAPAAGAPWSDAPIDVSGLDAVDADFTLSTGQILVRKIKVGKSAVKVVLKDKKLALDLTELALYGGAGNGRITLDGTAAAPALGMVFDLKGIQTEPLLRDAADFDKLKASGDASIDVRTSGKSQKEMIARLQGKGAVALRDGALKGFNLESIAQNIGGGGTGADETKFAELGGTYTIADGVLKNSDLGMKAPLMRLMGEGTVDLRSTEVNYRLNPKLAATLQGQGGKSDAIGITVPIIVSGPWTNLSYKPDLSAMLKGAASAPLKVLEGAAGAVGAGVGALKNLIPGAGSSQPAGTSREATPARTPPAAPSNNPFGGLKKLFGN
ncbi:MAG: AsmA family protein [Alphaproteobacteria bacterium]|nr:AsmA family protein [Alphaproteobacteria bacterium]